MNFHTISTKTDNGIDSCLLPKYQYEIHTKACNMNQALVEVIQLACSFTKKYRGVQYQQWRSDIAYQALILNRVTTAMVYDSGNLEIWKMSQFDDDPLLLTLNDDEDDGMKENNDDDANLTSEADNTGKITSHENSDYHGDNNQEGRRVTVELPRGMYLMGLDLKSDLNLRVPLRVSQRLQEKIMDHDSLPKNLDPIQEMQILDRVHTYMDGYREFRKILTAPLPLPWVQLARIFVFAYCFTLPFALFDDQLDMGTIQSFFVLLIVTYGFVGCELLYIELDDAFGDDANDLPVVEESVAAATDILLSLASVDGIGAAHQIQQKMPIQAFAIKEFYGNKLAKNDALKSKKLKECFDKRNEEHDAIAAALSGKETDPLLKKCQH